MASGAVGGTYTTIALFGGAAVAVAVITPMIVDKSNSVHTRLENLNNPSAPPAPPAHPSPPGPPPSPQPPSTPPTAGRRLAELAASMKAAPVSASTYKFTHAELSQLSKFSL